MNNAFSFDPLDNPTSWKGKARTFNANHQETSGGTSQFNYDSHGDPPTYKGSRFFVAGARC